MIEYNFFIAGFWLGAFAIALFYLWLFAIELYIKEWRLRKFLEAQSLEHKFSEWKKERRRRWF